MAIISSVARIGGNYHKAKMTEVLPLPTGLFGKSCSTEELNKLHAWPSDISPPVITAEEQRDLQQITHFREQIEKEIEVRRYECAAVYVDSIYGNNLIVNDDIIYCRK